MQIASTGRIKEDGPGDIAFVFIAVGFLHRPCHQAAIDDERFHKIVAYFRVGIVHDVHDQAIPVALIVDCTAKCCSLGCEQVLWRYFINQVHDFYDVMFRICQKVVNGFLESRPLDVVGCLHRYPSSLQNPIRCFFYICRLY